ncbi:hypothetical protein [Leptolyngbya sp. 7M]|uniref:hypothetical protein n=1 Tax=Leptolyngbya sp. 7M TaxID=2812896 RepID=UPI001B8C072E|nr:hypothetical protein JVX88_07275 [Leptolyngbya sp. 7M]
MAFADLPAVFLFAFAALLTRAAEARGLFSLAFAGLVAVAEAELCDAGFLFTVFFTALSF